MRRPAPPWFVYHRSAGKISAVPVAPAGWLALIGFIGATVAVGCALSWLLAPVHPLAAVGIGLPLLTAAILGFMRFVVLPHGIAEPPR